MNTPYVFISYSTIDQEYANKIYEFLTTNNISAWIATKNIHGGESFANEITKAVEDCKAFIFVLSENSDKSPHCGNELSMAFSQKKVIIPVRLHEFSLSKSNTYFLQQSQWIDYFKNEGVALNELLDKTILALNEKSIETKAIKIKTAEEKQIENYIKRAYQALEEKNFDQAEEFAEQILNINMEYAEAYLIKFLCEFKLINLQQLKKHLKPINDNRNYKYAKQYANAELLSELNDVFEENTKYNNYFAVKEMIKLPFDYDTAEKILITLGDYKQSKKILSNLSEVHDNHIIVSGFYPYISLLFIYIRKKFDTSLTEAQKKEKNQKELQVIEKLKQSAQEAKNQITANIAVIKNETLKQEILRDYETILSLSDMFFDKKFADCISKFEQPNLFNHINEESVKRLISLCNESEEDYEKYIEDERKARERSYALKEQQEKDEKKSKIFYGIIIGILVFIFCGPMSFIINLTDCRSCSTSILQNAEIDTTMAESIENNLENIILINN